MKDNNMKIEQRTRSEIQKYLKFNNRDHFRKNILNPLIKGGLLKLTSPVITT